MGKQTLNKNNCPLTDEWIKKMWYIYIYPVGYYSTIKKNEIIPFAATLMDLEIIILSDVSQTKKDKYRLYVESKKRIQINLFTKQKQTLTENKLMVTQWEGGER